MKRLMSRRYRDSLEINVKKKMRSLIEILAKYLSRQFTKGETQMVNKYVKWYLKSLIQRNAN